MSKATTNESGKRVLTTQLSIQPNIPSHMMLSRQRSGSVGSNGRRLVSQRSAPNFPTKTLRMKSLLWTKPSGVATSTMSSTVAQLIPTLIVNLAALSSGLSLGFSAITLPHLKADVSGTNATGFYQPFHVGMEAGSWIASIFGLGAIFGGFASAYIGSKYGRRKALLMMAVPDLVGWIMIAASQNLPMMLIGRFLSGFSAAGYSPSIQIYIAEVAQPQHRGWLGGITMPTLAFGNFLAYVIGSVLPWHVIAILGAVVVVVMIPGLMWLHDSPYWYLQRGDDRKALAVMERFRSADSNALSELLAISDSLTCNADEYSIKDAVKHLTSRQYRRPFLVLNFLFLLMAFSGNFAISFYAVEIFQTMGKGHINEYLSAIIIGLIKLIGALLFIPAVKYLTRRVLICGSALVMGISLSILGMAMYSHETGLLQSLDHVSWLPLVCIIPYMLVDPMGLGSVPFLYVAEFFPAEMRSILSGITIGLSNLELFIVVKTFPNLSHMVGDSGTFWLYASCCFATIVYTLLFIPETKGSTLEDIEQYFSHKENIHATPLPTPMSTPQMVKKGLAPYPHQSLQFTL